MELIEENDSMGHKIVITISNKELTDAGFEVTKWENIEKDFKKNGFSIFEMMNHKIMKNPFYPITDYPIHQKLFHLAHLSIYLEP